MPVLIMTVIFIVLIFFTGILLVFSLRKQVNRYGVLLKNWIYRDTPQKPGEIIISRSLPLKGKPDYIIKEKNAFIPVEVKTGKTPIVPYVNHTMQLMVYCLLIEEQYGIKPPGGYLWYPKRVFKLAYTVEAKQSIYALVAEILSCKKSNAEQHCSHTEHYT